jgi:hypothetical protein
MQYPPPGYGYGPRPHPGGYGGPPRSGPNAAVIALIVIVALVVIGGGGCLVCGLFAGIAATHDADAGERTVDRTPTAMKLESALRSDGVPLDHVECPVNASTTGSFSCAVIPPNEGDPAEVTVTNGPGGMAYKLQEGFVILEGAKLASTFASIVARMGSPPMTVPCFRGKIMKHADTNFTCEVQSGGTLVGYVTTDVMGKSGEVKMDYQPVAKPNAPVAKATANGGGTKGSLDGTYACSMSTYQRGPTGILAVQIVPSTLPRFTISGGSYTSGGKTGMIRTSGDQVVLFLDGAYDGWQGLRGTSTTGRYITFRGTSHGDAQPGVAAKIGDHQCYVQK